jgi:hypothetical protein
VGGGCGQGLGGRRVWWGRFTTHNLRFLCQSASILLRGEREQSQYSCARPCLASPPSFFTPCPSSDSSSRGEGYLMVPGGAGARSTLRR